MKGSIIKFNSIQISDFLTLMERHDLFLDIESDAQASIMFGELYAAMYKVVNSDMEMSSMDTGIKPIG